MRNFIPVALLLLVACNNKPKLPTDRLKPSEASTSRPLAGEATGEVPEPRGKNPVADGKGSLSFKLDGKLVESDPGKTKCWSTVNVPLAMMMAKGEKLTAGWQMPFTKDKTSYVLDAGSTGASFTIDGKNYSTRKRKVNYINVEITNVKEYYNVYLLSGKFEGVVEDNDGKKFNITEGRFVTESL